MDLRSELVTRLSVRRAQELGGLSNEAFEELVCAVCADPDAFVVTTREQACAMVCTALDRYNESTSDDDLLSDKEYLEERRKRFDTLSAVCTMALACDPEYLDAALLCELTRDCTPDELLDALYDLDERAGQLSHPGGTAHTGGPVPLVSAHANASDTYNDILAILDARQHLRIRAAMARTCLSATHYRLACELCEDLFDSCADGSLSIDVPSTALNPLILANPLVATDPLACIEPHEASNTLTVTDPLGARFTWALALARLEDEEGFYRLQDRCERQGNAWFYLAHTLLLYKLGRMSAARRALLGFCELYEGGAYGLLHPTYVETYLPCRPDYLEGSFEEVVLAVFEANPIVMDTPGFTTWAQEQRGVSEAARAFRDANGLE